MLLKRMGNGPDVGKKALLSTDGDPAEAETQMMRVYMAMCSPPPQHAHASCPGIEGEESGVGISLGGYRGRMEQGPDGERGRQGV